MPWVSWFLLESTAALGAALFTVDFVLLVIWRRTGRRRPLLIGLALTAALLLLQTAVVTRREQAVRILKHIERDLIAARTTTLAQCLSPDFQAGNMNATAFVDFVARHYEWLRIRSLNRGRVVVQESQPGSFIIQVPYRADIVAEQYAGLVRTRWRITITKTDRGWRIRQIEPTYIEGLAGPDWEQLDRF